MTTMIADELIYKLSSRGRSSVLASNGGNMSEDYLVRKLSKDVSAAKDIEIGFTTDAGLLHQYYRLRDEMFFSVWGMDRGLGKEEPFDSMSHIVVARQGLQVIAGGRVTISSPAHPQPLPMEKYESIGPDFSLKKLLPELSLADRTYCEFSRLAILPDFNASKLFPEMASSLIRRAIAEGAEYVFNMSPISQASEYNETMRAFDLSWNTRNDIEIPDREEFDGTKMALSVMSLSSAKIRQPQEEQAKTIKYEELIAG